MKQRAPKGYRIKLWPNGFYHVYRVTPNLMDCIDEVLSRKEALRIASEDAARRNAEAATLKLNMQEGR